MKTGACQNLVVCESAFDKRATVKGILALASIAFLFGCATKVGDIEEKNEVALIIGENSGLGSSINPLGVSTSVAFKKHNDTSLSWLAGAVNPARIEIQPGEHSIVAVCSWKRGGLNLRGEQTFVEVFEAGKVYYFRSVLRAGGVCGLEMRVDS